MIKVTQGTIRQMIRKGVAEDISKLPFNEAKEYAKNETVFYSVGVYGVNGCIMRDIYTGKYYAIVGRTTALFTCL